MGGATATTYPSGFGTILDSAVDKIRHINGDELTLAGWMAAIAALLALASPYRPRMRGFALCAALVPLLVLQTIVLVELGSPFSDRYVLTPAVILIVLVPALALTLWRGRGAIAATAVILLAVPTAPISGRGLTAPTFPRPRHTIGEAKTERAEQESLFRLAAKPQVTESISRGCDEVTVSGRGGPHYMFAAKPLIAYSLGLPTEEVEVARTATPPGPEGGAFLRRVAIRPPLRDRRELDLPESLHALREPIVPIVPCRCEG